MRKIYPRDSVWRSQNGQRCYKTFAGGINRFNTEKEARHSKVVWRPQLSRLFKEGVMKKGDKLSLKLAGESNPLELELEGTRGKTIVFAVHGKQYSLKEIKEVVAKKMNKPGKKVNLNYNQSIHLPSNKSLNQLKREYISQKRDESAQSDAKRWEQPFDFLSDFTPVSDPVEEASIPETEDLEVSNFRGDFKKYEEAQFNILSELQTISEDKRMRCYKGSLIMFLSDTDE